MWEAEGQQREYTDRSAAHPGRHSTLLAERKLAVLVLCLPLFQIAACFGQDMPAQNDPVAPLPAPGPPVSVTATYAADLNISAGGSERDGPAALGRIALLADADLQRLVGIRSAKAHVSVIDIFGTGLSASRIDNLAAVSGIEAEPALRLNQLWIEFGLGSAGRFRIGKFPASQDFAVSDTASFFINASFGWPASFASDLPQGGPSWPLASPGGMLKLNPSSGWTLSAAVFAGKPAGMDTTDPQRHDGHGFGAFNLAGKPFVIVEAARKVGNAATVKLGGWLHFNRFGLLHAQPGNVAPNWSIYGLADWRVAGAADSKRQLSVFVRATLSPDDRNPVPIYLDFGATLSSPFKSRPDDVVGLAFANARLSSRLGPPVSTSGEKVVEFSYSAALPRGLKVQPNLQLIIDPTDPATFVTNRRAVLVGGIRLSGSL